MKLRITTICMAALLGAFAMVTSSCSDDEEKDPVVVDEEEIRLDDVDYLRRTLVRTDDEGQFEGLLLGAFIDESQPTTAFIGVDDEEEAFLIWESLIPYDAYMQTDGATVVLTDEDGNRQGTMMFHHLDGLKEIAEITFSSPTLIDSHLSRIVFIPSSLWPNNDAPQVFPAPTIMTRKTTGERYAVISMPQNGKTGYLFHVGEKCYFTADEHREGIKVKYYASKTSMAAIASALGKDTNLWANISKASGIDESNLKNGQYFVSQCLLGEYVYSFKSRAFSPVSYIPAGATNTKDPKWAGCWNYPTKVYKITNDGGVYTFTWDHAFSDKEKASKLGSEASLTWDDFEY